jgi:hypothetical protein
VRAHCYQQQHLSPAGPLRASYDSAYREEERCGVVVRGGVRACVWVGTTPLALQSLSTVPLMWALCAHNDDTHRPAGPAAGNNGAVVVAGES